MLHVVGLAALEGCHSAPAEPAWHRPAAPRLAFDGPGFDGGVVATSERLPAEAAAAVLRQGGNAVDAAAVAQFMLNVVEPQSSGIGGGGFMMIHLAASGETVIVDSRETAPAAASPDMFLDDGGAAVPFALASTSGYAVGVPGALRGIETALARWGTISLADALAPAIRAAEDGIVVGRHLAEMTAEPRLQTECGAHSGRSPWDAARAVFTHGSGTGDCGTPLLPGETLRQPDLGRTFRLIAARGPDAFYDCADPSGLASAIVAAQSETRAALGARGAGRMSCADLAAYRPVLREPVVGEYRGFIVRSAPPPSSGGIALLQMLKMLARFPMGDPARGFGPGGSATLNVMQDAMRLAFADRAMWVGDPDRMPGLPLRGLIDDRYIRLRADSCPAGDPARGTYCITAGARLDDVRPGDPRPFEGPSPSMSSRTAGPDRDEGQETTHLTIVDRWGNVVTATTTVEAGWGTGLMVPGFGFLLNNELTDFNSTPRRHGAPGDADYDPGANDVGPLKRPRSSMTPTILFVRDGDAERPVAAYGSPGGSTIINTVLALTLDLVDGGLSAEAAVARPRISLTSAADGATTRMEAGFASDVIESLRRLGYRIAAASSIGAVQAAVIDPGSGRVQGAADPRRDGTSIGIVGP